MICGVELYLEHSSLIMLFCWSLFGICLGNNLDNIIEKTLAGYGQQTSITRSYTTIYLILFFFGYHFSVISLYNSLEVRNGLTLGKLQGAVNSTQCCRDLLGKLKPVQFEALKNTSA